VIVSFIIHKHWRPKNRQKLYASLKIKFKAQFYDLIINNLSLSSMPKQINLEVLLKDHDALRKADWEQLMELKTKHPFSNLLSIVMAKKQFLESGHVDNQNFRTALFQANNPAVVLSNILSEDNNVIGAKSNKKKQKENPSEESLEKAPVLEEEITNLAEVDKEPDEISVPDQVPVLPEPKEEMLEKKEEIIREEKPETKNKTKIPEVKPDKYIQNDFTVWLLNKNAEISPITEVELEDLDDLDSSMEPLEDLDTNLKDAILSESLAEIYVKQGLKQEAIEMYKKLSLKNPKKSTYFAGIIENLKKN
jgi:hypothetical protein